MIKKMQMLNEDILEAEQESAAEKKAEAAGGTPEMEDVIEFLKNNPNPPDSKMHSWCEKNKYNPHKAEAVVYILATKMVSVLTGGKSKGKSAKELKLDEKQIAAGIKVELEHTSDEDVARKIATDHIYEFPNYYIELAKMEDKLKG